MRNDIEDCLKTFNRSGGRAGSIENQRLTSGAGGSTRKTAKWIHSPHRFGETWCLAVEHHLRSFRREIPRTESGATGRDDESVESIGHLKDRFADRLNPIGNDAVFNNVETFRRQTLNEGSTTLVVAGSGGDAIGNSQDFGRQTSSRRRRCCVVSH